MAFEWHLRAPWWYRQPQNYNQYYSLGLLKWIKNDCPVKCNLSLSILIRSVLALNWYFEYSENHQWPGSHPVIVKYCHSAETDQHLKVILRWEVAAAAIWNFSGSWDWFFSTTSGITGVRKQPLLYSFFPTEVPQRISEETNKRVNDIF